jgi:transcriptional regulator with GAF, ATPase, and Fis domain
MSESPPSPATASPTVEASDALQRIALQMTSVLELPTLLRTIADGLVTEFGAALARIWLLEAPTCDRCTDRDQCPHRTARLRLGASAGLSERLDGRYREVALGALKIGIIAVDRKPVCVDDVTRDPRIADPAWVQANALRAFAGYPLLFRGELLGVMALFTRRALTTREFERVGAFANQAAVAIKNARLFTDLDALTSRLRAENAYLRDEVNDARSVATPIGRSAAWLATMEAVQQVAGTDATVSITGETGTGKELLAQAIHVRSARRDGPLVRMNCAAVAPTLLESELFGHERGAFTGASARRIGRFELAHRGTLFLDEIGELSLDAQAAMLRVLQEREFERVGGSEPIRVDVRVIAATNRDLRAAVAEGRFRADLFYRLDVFPIVAPPLRDRIDDVPILADEFLARASRRLRKPMRGFAPAAVSVLVGYDWPGNVRELENVIERAVILARSDRIEPDNLPALASGMRTRSAATTAMEPSTAPADASVNALVAVERAHIMWMLRESDGRIEGPTGAAARLGLRPSTLRSRMAKLGIRRESKR